jgi:hypothetical protein
VKKIKQKKKYCTTRRLRLQSDNTNIYSQVQKSIPVRLDFEVLLWKQKRYGRIELEAVV